MDHQHPSAPERALINLPEPSALTTAIRVGQEMLTAYGTTDYADPAAVAQALGAIRESLRILLRALGAEPDGEQGYTNLRTPGGEARDLRALLEAVVDAITLPYGCPSYDSRLAERAGIARVVARAALDENPTGLVWNTDYLRGQIVAEQNDTDKQAKGGAVR